MSNTIENVKDLNTSRTEGKRIIPTCILPCLRLFFFSALQGLLRSLGNTTSSGTTLSTEQLQKLSEKINEILGNHEDRGLTPGDQLNQVHVLRKCNLLNCRLSNTAPE